MQLRRLEAFGFKSFADKLDIEFDRGITAIVGPNGSGKSNITDAIRWVLGEQNVRNLRGSKTEDIIFTGSANRRALGVAEVSLTFDNHAGKLPVDFQEVVVTRRLFRSGESEFYINKARCRLKDIYDLFADTGLGRDAISVISQNKIDQVLNSRPEERRLLFEEAAGITKYRNRKRESLKKLEDTEQNVLRVNDILQEIENQLGPLAESAEKTRKYNELNEKHSQCKVTLLLHQYEAQKIKLEEIQRQKAEIKQANEDSEVNINLLEVEKERLNNELMEVEKSLQLLNDKNNELNEKIEKNNTEIALYQERLRQSDEHDTRIAGLRENLLAGKNETEERLKSVEMEIASTTVKAHEVETLLLDVQQKERNISAEIERQEHILAEMKEKSFQQAQEFLQKKNDIAMYERDIAEKQQQCGEYEKELLAFTDGQADKSAALKTLLQEVEMLNQENLRVKADKDSFGAQLKEICLTQQKELGRIQQVSQRLDTERTRLRFLQGMQEEYEGFGRGVKRVLKNDLPWNQGVCGAVAEIIKMDAKFALAVEIALGGSAQNVITENDETAKAAIAFLKREKLGRVTFLPLNTIVSSHKNQQESTIEHMPGIIGYANTLVQCDAKYRHIVDFLLAKTVVADRIDTALQFAKSRNYRVRVVTLDGEMLNPGGSLTGGSNGRRETSFFNRAGEIADLLRLIEQDEAVLTVLRKEHDHIDLQVNQINEQLNKVIEKEQHINIRYAQKNVYLEKAEKEYQANVLYGNTLQEKADGCRRKLKQLAVLLADGKKDIAAFSDIARRQKDDEEMIGALQSLRSSKAENDAVIVDYKIKKTVVAQEKIRADERKANLERALLKTDAEMERLLSEEKKLHDDTLSIKGSLRVAVAKNDRLKTLRGIGGKDYDHFHQVKLEKLVGMQKQEQELKNLRKKFNDWQSKLHQTDILLTQAQFALENCLLSLEEDYQLSLEEAAMVRLEENPAAIERRVAAVEREMDVLGAINPNAISEYETLQSRYGFIKKQLDDLMVAKEYLMGIIKDIDITMSKQFSDAFAEISRHFGEIFTRLFGGGQANLELSSTEAILEAGIEISVQPPNKKAQNLSVLSGGERALTVIALLFSFLKFRPAPFSVVDEIDAPLDEANVDRFGSFLKEYAQNTQFIVVTHRKGTMKVADVMHGVTVEDSGVSKIISVKLEDRKN